MAKIFFVGATGHIGGAVLDLVLVTYPSASLTALVRDDAKGRRLLAKYPTIKILVGDMHTIDIVESASREADIIINTAPDVTQGEGISAILRGIGARPQKGYYIHTSGAAWTYYAPDGSESGEKVWDDINDIETIISLPEDKVHIVEDKLVFGASSAVNVAIVSPTMVHGFSPSIEHPFPITLPTTLKTIQLFDTGFTISDGKNLLGCIHVLDLAQIYLLLLANAIKSIDSATEKDTEAGEIWGPKGYYFARTEDVSFADYMAKLVKVLKNHGVLKSEDIKQMSLEEAKQASAIAEGGSLGMWTVHILASFGANMRARASRAKNLGWAPTHVGIMGTVEGVLEKYLESEKGA